MDKKINFTLNKRKTSKSPYMSSSEQAAALTRLELGIIRITEGFSRWVEELNKFASKESLNYQDVAVLHAIRMRGGARNLSEILIFLNRHDVSTIHYCLRKLEKVELVKKVSGASKREASYALTEKGQEVTAEYARLREVYLLSRIGDMRVFDDGLDTTANVIECLISTYEQSVQALLSERAIRKTDIMDD